MKCNVQGQHEHVMDVLGSGLKAVTIASGASKADIGR